MSKLYVFAVFVALGFTTANLRADNATSAAPNTAGDQPGVQNPAGSNAQERTFRPGRPTFNGQTSGDMTQDTVAGKDHRRDQISTDSRKIKGKSASKGKGSNGNIGFESSGAAARGKGSNKNLGDEVSGAKAKGKGSNNNLGDEVSGAKAKGKGSNNNLGYESSGAAARGKGSNNNIGFETSGAAARGKGSNPNNGSAGWANSHKTKGAGNQKGGPHFSASDKTQLAGQLNGKSNSKVTADTWTKGGITSGDQKQGLSSFRKEGPLDFSKSEAGTAAIPPH